jgi:hypothetical protein
MAKFSFVEADIDGEGKRWRLVIDAGEYLTLADEDFTIPRKDLVENDDRIVGPFTVMQLLESVRSVLPKGQLFICRTCGQPFERHASDSVSVDCQKCQDEIAERAEDGDQGSSPTIIAIYDARAEQWVARFDDRPQVAFGGDMPVVAIRRLLKETEAESDDYALICDADLSGRRDPNRHTIYRSIIWNPPELLLPCGDCRERGEYVGLLEREMCRTCGERKVVPV